MKIAKIVIKLKHVVPTSSGICLFLGNEQKVFIIYVDPVMGEQIRFAFSKQTQSRPLTSDFIRYILCSFDIFVQAIVLYHANQGTFFSKAVFRQFGSHDHIVEIDIRPSDAILLSLTMNKPLMIDSDLFETLSDESDLLKNFSQMGSK